MLGNAVLSVFLTCSSPPQRELLCTQMGVATTLSQEAFEEEVFRRTGGSDFRMETLRR